MNDKFIEDLHRRHEEDEPFVLALEKFLAGDYRNNELYEEAVREVFDAGKRSASQWIPVETLPTEQGDYLVSKRRSGEVCIRFINPDEEGTRAYARNYFEAWMPIPNPYQPDDKEQRINADRNHFARQADEALARTPVGQEISFDEVQEVTNAD